MNKKIVLKKGIWVTVNPQGDFYASVGGDIVEGQTKVSLLYQEEYLQVSFEGNMDLNLDFNRFDCCNDPLYEQEVFECFIAKGEDAPIDYIEIEINPNNALFVSKVHNPNKMGTENTTTPIDCQKSKIIYDVIKNKTNKEWKANLKLPFSLINYPNTSGNVYRINFFRIRSKIQQKDNLWRASQDNSDYGCWKSTMTTEKPNFHRTDFMGFIILQQ